MLAASNLRVPVRHLLTAFLRDQQGALFNPAMVTLVDCDGFPVLQNSSSVGFYGNLAANKLGLQDRSNMVRFWDALFGLDKVTRWEGSWVVDLWGLVV